MNIVKVGDFGIARILGKANTMLGRGGLNLPSNVRIGLRGTVHCGFEVPGKMAAPLLMKREQMAVPGR